MCVQKHKQNLWILVTDYLQWKRIEIYFTAVTAPIQFKCKNIWGKKLQHIVKTVLYIVTSEHYTR